MIDREDRRIPLTENQLDMLSFLDGRTATMREIMAIIDTEDALVDAVASVVAESKMQGLIEPTSPYQGKGKTKWKITKHGKRALNEYV